MICSLLHTVSSSEGEIEIRAGVRGCIIMDRGCRVLEGGLHIDITIPGRHPAPFAWQC